MPTSTPKRFAFPMLALAAIAGGSFLATTTLHSTDRARADAPARILNAEMTTPPKPSVVAPANDLSAAFRSVHTSVKDAVVQISTSKTFAPGAMGRVRPEIPDELRRFFPDIPDTPMPRRGGKAFGTGSGVVVTADGYILTNNHVVEDADDITVRLDDGREFKAKTVGRDPKTDLAVIRVDAGESKLTYAKLGDSDALDVGDWVLAFGSPFGFDQTMTQGIISAKGRSNVNIIGANNPALAGLTYENFLQTDAAINPGNSGGPLVNLKGEVIGINTAIASRTGGYNGIGFAIPSNDARHVMDSLIKNGKIVRGYMGVGIIDIQIPEVRQRVKKEGYSGTTGVLVERVEADSPGGKGGLKPGDIITAIGGKPVTNISTLRNTVARTTPGDKVDLKVWRDGKTIDLSFAAGQQPETAVSLAGRGSESGTASKSPALGMTVKPLDEDAAKKYNLKPNTGVIVSELGDEDSLAAAAGLRPGDVITSINRTPVTTPEAFADAVKKADLSAGLRLTVRSANGADRLVYIEKK